MKKTFASLITLAFLSVLSSAQAVPIAAGSSLLLPYDFGAPISLSPSFWGPTHVVVELTTSLSDPIDGGEAIQVDLIDDASGSIYVGTVQANPPAFVYSGPILTMIDTSVFPLHTGDLAISVFGFNGSIDLIDVVLRVHSGLGDLVGYEDLLDPIPAPGALALLGVGLLGFRMRRRTA